MQLGGQDQDSWVYFGEGFDERGSFHYFDIIKDQAKWAIPIAEVSINDKNLFIESQKVFLDTGNSFTVVPSSDYQKMYSEILKTTSCFQYAQLPDFTFCECGGDPIEYPVFELKFGVKE